MNTYAWVNKDNEIIQITIAEQWPILKRFDAPEGAYDIHGFEGDDYTVDEIVKFVNGYMGLANERRNIYDAYFMGFDDGFGGLENSNIYDKKSYEWQDYEDGYHQGMRDKDK